MKDITNDKLNFIIKREKIKNHEIYLQEVAMFEHKNDNFYKSFQKYFIIYKTMI